MASILIFRVAEPIKSFVFGAIGEYVGYIGSCDNNLGALRKSLSEVCDKKDDISKKVKDGKEKQEEITREAASWLKDVRILTEDEQLKDLMYKDVETAIYVVKLMDKRNLKRSVRQESEMQELVIKVMKKLTKEMDKSPEEIRKIVEEDYKEVAEVVVEVMKDTIDEFKKLIKEDKKMAVIATRMLKDRDLDKLTKGDQEMEEIVREAGNISDEELLFHDYKDDESNTLPVKIPNVEGEKNTIKEAAKKLFTPLANLVEPLKKLMDDANFKEVVPEADAVKLGLEVIDGVLIKGRWLKKDSTRQHRVCGTTSLAPGFHDRYLISKAAEFLNKHIKDDFITKYPRDPVTLPIRTVDLKPIPTQFLEGLESRTKLLNQIMEKLIVDQVDSVGVFGMGGTGKTTLVKEVMRRVKDQFGIKVIVEVSDAPDFVRIQATIAESIDLPLHDVNNVAQRAIRLYNRLSSESKKILIVLDNVWKKLNLDEIGIPHSCKFLLTTRDRDVCRIMDVRDANIISVGMMNTNEARELFKSQTGNIVDLREYKNVVDRLLSKCGGLPLAIVATANSLKDKDLSSWEKFADDLEKPISSQISGDYHLTFSILNTSYKFIQPVGKRLFFLLASLSPPGSSLSIETLLRYGIGLNLFVHVNKLSEAMEQAVTWANELVQSSMLLEGNVKGEVQIHDIVRDFAISYAAKEEEHTFMVECIPRWLDDKTLKKFTAMSLTWKNDYNNLLSGVEAYKLQILNLKGDLSSGIEQDFFDGMVNLEVLVLSNMNFQPSLPKSMGKLKELKTLCMEGCKLGNIELVGKLVNLFVLSLRESFIESIPNEVGNLRKLRLLDLGRSTTTKLPLIPTGVLSKLSRLEGLYIDNNRQSIFKTESDCEAITEIVRLPYLNALEIKVSKIDEVPQFDAQFMRNLDKFIISIGGDIRRQILENFGCILILHRIENVVEYLEQGSLKALLRKTDYLDLRSNGNFANLVPQLDEEGFKSLRYLRLGRCDDLKCIIDWQAANKGIVFPCLQTIELNTLSLEMVCNRDVSPGTFSNLQSLNLYNMNDLLYGLPLVPRDMHRIDVSCCKLIKFIFLEDEEIQATIELPFLWKLNLFAVPSLLGLVGPKDISNTNDCLQGAQFFFDEKIVLPSLEVFQLTSCENVFQLWSKEICKSGFQNLKDVDIKDCKNLSSLGPHSVIATLVQLETLKIHECEQMVEVISFETAEETEVDEHIIQFPRLKDLEICTLGNLKNFYRGGSQLDFPKLKKMLLTGVMSMKKFGNLENSSALFHDKVNFPCLEELWVFSVNNEVRELWHEQSFAVMSNRVPMLRRLALNSSTNLRQIPCIVLENLSALKLNGFRDEDVLFSSSCFGEKEGLSSVYSQLPNLEELQVREMASLKDLFGTEDQNAADDALASFCGQFKKLVIYWLPALNIIPLHLFKSIISLKLIDVKWNYLISADVLEDSLQQLQILHISSCDNLEALVIHVGSHIKLPSLKRLLLEQLRSFKGISDTPKTEAVLFLPLLESLKVHGCYNLEYFWSGPIVAPRLQDVSLDRCYNMRRFLAGNLEDTIELPSTSVSVSLGSVRESPNHKCDLQLPSMEIVRIEDCPNLRSFSLKRVVAPKLTQITYNCGEYSMLPYDDLNHFLQDINPTSDYKDKNLDKHYKYVGSLRTLIAE